MALATLSIDLVARLAQFEKDLGGAARVAEKQSAAITGAIGKVSGAIKALAGAAAVGGLAAMVRGQIDAIDKFNDLKDATGASIENISALDGLARRTGVTFEDMSGILVKFNKALADAKSDNDAGRVFKALGLDFEKLRQLDPAEALRQTAVAMQGFARDGNLARATQELFGKSVEQAAPFLKDLAEAGKLNATTTTEQAEAAETLNKQIYTLKANAEDLKRELVAGLLPAMSKLLENYRAIKELGSLDLILKDAARGILPWGDPKMTGDNGADINRQLEERAKLEKQLASAVADRRGAHVKTLKEEIATVNRYLEVLRIKQRTEVLAGVSAEVPDALSRRMTRGAPSVKIPGPKGKVDPSIEKGRKLAESMALAEAGYSPDFIEKMKDLNAAYAVGAIKLDGYTESVERLVKQQPFMKKELFLGDIDSDALSRKLADLDAVAKGLADLNTELDRLADGGDGRKQRLTARLEARLNAGEVFSPEQLDRIVRGIGGVSQEFAQAKDIAGEFAAVFESGFEKAILSGEKLSGVIKALGMDILQIGIRTAITQPLGKMAGNWLGGLFSSFLPSFDVGTDFVPRDMVAKIHKGERIVPAAQNKPGAGGQTTVINNFTVGDVASMSKVREAIAASQRATAGSLMRSRQYGGAFA